MAEIFLYITATLLAGVRTGLVGLPAATVMVPILIVLCPPFSEETGAYPHVGDWRWSRRAGGSPVWKAPCGAAAGRPQEDMGGNRGYGAYVQGDRNGGYAGADCDALASMHAVCFGRICSRGLYRAYHPEWQRHSNRPRGRCRGAPGSRPFDCELKRQFVSFCLSIFLIRKSNRPQQRLRPIAFPDYIACSISVPSLNRMSSLSLSITLMLLTICRTVTSSKSVIEQSASFSNAVI